nr:orotidine 5'-phosphate decarboxylase [Candidatus Prometheoarchaeum syntrophicum]
MYHKSFSDNLIDQIKQKKSIICIGLDPRIEESGSKIPQIIMERAKNNYNDAIWEFNKEIIDHTCEITPIFKPNIAFYSKYNALDALKKTIDYIHEKKTLVILDAKRNDIGSTAEAYAYAIFENFKADAVTFNGYLGSDGIAPFLKYVPKGKGVIVLLKTSNKSSGEFQDLFSISIPEIPPSEIETTIEKGILIRNYIQMARLIKLWGENPKLVGEGNSYGTYGYSNILGVVGATFPEQMKLIRKEIPKNFMLVPGYGAQGGTAKDIINSVNEDGFGAIISASRSINFAYQKSPYKEEFDENKFGPAAGKAAKDMREAINNALEQSGKIGY